MAPQLQVGRLGCSGHTHGCVVPPNLRNWTKTHFAAFAIVSSPLVLSVVLTDDVLAPLLDIIGNKGALAVNQAWAGHPGTLVRDLPPVIPPCVGPCLAAGNVAVAVPCNSADTTTGGWAYDKANRRITNKGLCLSTDGWHFPLVLRACGNTSTFQEWTFDSSSGHFEISCPAGGSPKPYPAALTAYPLSGSDHPVQAYAYRPAGSPNFAWKVATAAGTIEQPSSGYCLAAREAYVPAPQPSSGAGLQLWAKPVGGGRVAALVINGWDVEYNATIMVGSDLNMSSPQPTVTDVWSGSELGRPVAGNFTIAVAAMDSAFVLFSP